jgi:hypothetical protein
VAWRGDTLPADPRELIDRIRGAAGIIDKAAASAAA